MIQTNMTTEDWVQHYGHIAIGWICCVITLLYDKLYSNFTNNNVNLTVMTTDQVHANDIFSTCFKRFDIIKIVTRGEVAL